MSTLALGTVQFGLPYGIANTTGQPRPDVAHSILDAALGASITDIDTAAVYGSSEAVLGSWKGKREIRIVTKSRRPPDNSSEDLEASLDESLERLGLPRVHGFLLHESRDVFRPEMLAALARLRESGNTSKVGVSIYDPEEAREALGAPEIDIIQVPNNILDRRLDDSGFFLEAAKAGKEIWIRSVFLQGFLFLSEESIPSFLLPMLPLRKRLEGVAREFDFDLGSAALLYTLEAHPGARILVGAETPGQLASHVRAWSRRAEFHPCKLALDRVLDEADPLDAVLLSPKNWPTK